MMIGPTNYINMSLSGRSYEAAKREVRTLWREIGRLKKVIEEHPDSDEMMICPMPEVKIGTYRDYLEAAREYFESQGWKYELTKDEIADKEFNDRLKAVQSIEISYGACLGYRDIRKITFDGNKIVFDKDLCGMFLPPDKIKEKLYEGMTKETLLEDLADLHIGEWKKTYDNPNVLDGIEWHVDFKYTDGKKRGFGGCNRYPYNFYGFLDIMQIAPIE